MHTERERDKIETENYAISSLIEEKDNMTKAESTKFCLVRFKSIHINILKE